MEKKCNKQKFKYKSIKQNNTLNENVIKKLSVHFYDITGGNRRNEQD